MFDSVAVLGSGQMGSGIAQVLAQHDFPVLLFDVSTSQMERARASIRHNLERQVQKGALSEGALEGTLGRISFTDQLSGLADADFYVEAVTESEPVKLELFRELDRLAKPHAVLASNTSSISITKIASVTGRADRVVGMHFMNPVPVMKLVEVIRGVATSDETFATTASLVVRLGKEMALSQDYPGFIVNRLLIPMINEAIFALHEGVGTAEDIDKAMKLGTNQPMGPLALADLIGLDTVLAIANVLYDGFKDSKYRPCPLLVKMVQAGQLGKKAGRGFYRYG